jgi:hypothetical protein
MGEHYLWEAPKLTSSANRDWRAIPTGWAGRSSSQLVDERRASFFLADQLANRQQEP